MPEVIRYSESNMALPDYVLSKVRKGCEVCLGDGWVCEDHPDKPFSTGSVDDCPCGAPGRPCRCTGLE